MNEGKLITYERILIALHVGGELLPSEMERYNSCGFNYPIGHKLTRLYTYLDECCIPYDVIGEEDGSMSLIVYADKSLPLSKKFFDWVDLKKKQPSWATSFILELKFWRSTLTDQEATVTVPHDSDSKSNTMMVTAIAKLSNSEILTDK